MSKKARFTPGALKLPDDVVQARKKAREEQLRNQPTVDEIIKEKQRRRTENTIQAIKENKKEIFFTYLFIFGIILAPVIIFQFFV